MTEEEDIAENVETGPPDQFVGRDLLESYIYYCNYVPSNPLERYNILVKSITFGMELLPNYIDPDETDEEQIKANTEKQALINAIYAEAGTKLKGAIPSKRQIVYDTVDVGGERVLLYKISANEDSDAKECHAKEKGLSTVLNNFVTQQHEQHIPKLQEIHNKILHELTQTGIVPSINPSLEQIFKEGIKSLHQEVMAAMIAEQLEEKDGKRQK